MKHPPPAIVPNLEGTDTILGIACTYQGNPFFVRPISQWFGANDFKKPQIWHQRVKDLVTGQELDWNLQEVDFTNKEAWARAKKNAPKALEVVQEVDPRQLGLSV